MKQNKLEVRDLVVEYEDGDRFRVIDRLNFEVANNEFVSIIGPSGCGKTTLMHCLAGFIEKKFGIIKLDNELVEGVSTKFGLVFQNHNILPWMNVAENIGFGLKIDGVEQKKIKQKVRRYTKLMGLTNFSHYYPHQLSGGMKQRVGIARALITDPKIILMDEPFGSLDRETRNQMQKMLLSILNNKKRTILFITHDIDEAIYMSDRIIKLSKTPTKNVEEFNIKLPRPRNKKMMLSEEFIKIKRKIVRDPDNYEEHI